MIVITKIYSKNKVQKRLTLLNSLYYQMYAAVCRCVEQFQGETETTKNCIFFVVVKSLSSIRKDNLERKVAGFNKGNSKTDIN